MPRVTKEERARLHMTMTTAVKERLDRLLQLSEAEDMSEVVRRALFVYEQLLADQRSGKKVVLHAPDGSTETVRIT